MYELYWLSKDLCRCSVEKTFPKYGDLILFNSSSLALLASSLSCDNKVLRNRDIFHLACFCLSLFLKTLCPCFSSQTLLAWNKKVKNALQDVHQVGWKGFWYWSDTKFAGTGSSLRVANLGWRFHRGEWTGPKLSATKVHLDIFQSKQLDFTCLLFKQIIPPSKKILTLSLSSSSLFQERNRIWHIFFN